MTDRPTYEELEQKVKILQEGAIKTARLAFLGELAAGAAHEINNPLTGIINYAQILFDEGGEQGMDTEIPKRLIKEGERIADIINRLLCFVGDEQENNCPVHVETIVSDTLILVAAQLRREGIMLRVDVPADLPVIKAQRQQIQQVFFNIIRNARYSLNQKFSGPHEDKILEIRASTSEIDGRKHITMAFRDHGQGILAGTPEKISHPFFTTNPMGAAMRLALHMSNNIIKNHGGRLCFTSLEGEYTKVTVDLPVAVSDEPCITQLR